jgi:hypothetical protein
LTIGVDVVVSLILVVPERGEIPDLVLQLTDLVAQLERRSQRLATRRKRSLQSCVGRDLSVQILVGGLPRSPVRKDALEVPLESIVNLIALTQSRR